MGWGRWGVHAPFEPTTTKMGTQAAPPKSRQPASRSQWYDKCRARASHPTGHLPGTYRAPTAPNRQENGYLTGTNRAPHRAGAGQHTGHLSGSSTDTYRARTG